MDAIYTGGCRCGAVRYHLEGEPDVVGLCHCADCRRETGSSFLAYADWPRERFSSTGAYATYAGRSFCLHCGAPVFHLSEDRAEIVLGSLDAVPSPFAPTREGWIIRREHWLTAVSGAGQFPRDPF